MEAKRYEDPDMEVIRFDAADIIRTSGIDGDDSSNEPIEDPEGRG